MWISDKGTFLRPKYFTEANTTKLFIIHSGNSLNIHKILHDVFLLAFYIYAVDTMIHPMDSFAFKRDFSLYKRALSSIRLYTH